MTSVFLIESEDGIECIKSTYELAIEHADKMAGDVSFTHYRVFEWMLDADYVNPSDMSLAGEHGKIVYCVSVGDDGEKKSISFK